MSIDLSKFTGDDRVRTLLQKPFNVGNFTYATNGHVVVRVPLQSGYPDGSDLPIDRVFAMYTDEEHVPVPAVKWPSGAVPCTICKGAGLIKCEDEDETWNEECEDCDGGIIDTISKTSATIGNAIINARYLRLIFDLPDAKIQRNPRGDDQPVSFSFDGGCGLVMPMRRHHDNIMVIDWGNEA